MLTHQSGIIAWVPFYKNTLETIVENGKSRNIPSPRYYAQSLSETYSVEIARNLFMKKEVINDIVFAQIIASSLRQSRTYLYSDLGMILMTELIKNASEKTLDDFAKAEIFDPLSMSRTLFNPTTRFDADAVAPTEEDDYFRFQRVQGYVHDMAAAMLGGVSGHAGLFSTAQDLAVLFQMLLNGGNYGGVVIFSPETIQLFTQRQNGSTRRGFGWDMKELNSSKSLNMSRFASDRTFGHTGFTGNAAYADPAHNLIYIFLSNRTYPDMNNNKLINGNYRTQIQDIIYEAIRKKD